ncbi:putative 2,4-dichlorophenol 6-monooxygenase [Seiridium unicorne]|uniref:2,4-dichlorophenol 6-monooxygenase n=1 Tax=Seiridium unicorne TaxID=138068 RepID=A0ABR2VE86_9PEZI
MTEEFDVVIVGGGPVGLLLGYQLQRFGVSACVLEQHDEETQDTYGRAISMFPRTTEQLDQLDVIEDMLQLAFACRRSVTYKDGERVIPGRVWTFMENIKDTTYDFVMVLRQMHTQRILRDKLMSAGAQLYQSVECIEFVVDETVPASSHPHAVTSTFLNKKTQTTFQLKSKFLIGADGGRSFVRRHANVPFEGDTTQERWIRIDGIVETDMPFNRAYGAIESKTHGNVLWAPLDHGATRIGYAYSDAIAAKYPEGVTQEVAEKEAIGSMRPFNVKFKEIHWWTLYNIGQRVARDLFVKERIFLCGDAAHTHSSGAAQGLNTGIHDAVNLAWKLALQVRGLTQPDVLQTYSTERISAVRRLINYDRDISTLMSYKWPSWYKGDVNADPHLVLGEIFEEAASFNTGLGISYASNVLNQSSTAYMNVVSGARPPDVPLVNLGTNEQTRLQRITRNFGHFWVVVFTGNVDSTRESLLKLKEFLQGNQKLVVHEAIKWVTITMPTEGSPYESLGMEPFGKAYFDNAYVAHTKLGIKAERGGVLILRPDGLVGFGGSIDGAWIREYFSQVLLSC